MPLPLKRLSVFADGLDHPECIAAHPDGSFYAGGEAGQVYRISADGKTIDEVTRTGGFTLGVSIAPDATWLAACDLKQHCLWRVDLKTGRASPLARGADAGGGATGTHQFNIPNSVAFNPDGSFFASESGAFREVSGKILRFDADGKGTVWHAGPFNFANGIALSPAGDALFVVCTWLPGVERIEIRPDGSPGKRSVYVRLPKILPDGICFDAKGNLYVACYTPSRIYKVTPDRKATVLVDDWEAHTLANPTNVCFGGENFDQLFAANLGRWHITQIGLKIRGAPLPCHKGLVNGGKR